MPKNEQNVRWSCKCCSYDNFPSAKECTLCNTGRDGRLSPSQTSDSLKEGKKYEASGKDKTQSSSDGKFICPTNSEHSLDLLEGRWACVVCTYLNWENSLKCVMCSGERLNDVIPQSEKSNPEISGKDTKSLSGKTDDLADLTVNNNERNKTISRNKQKWTCPHCTFDNWTKSKKCALCFHLKPKTEDSVILKSKNSQNEFNLKKSGRQRAKGPKGKSIAVGTQPITEEDDKQLIYGLAATKISSNVSNQYQIKRDLNESDWMWLSACIGVLEGERSSVESFLAMGGSPTRQLTADEILMLNRPGIFEVGDTLVHLGIRYHREDILAIILPPEVSRKAFKRVPCQVSSELAASVRKQAAQGLRQRKGDWPCYFFTDLVTFTLPGELQELPGAVQQYALDEIVDQNAQRVLELESTINWSVEITNQLDSHVYALWNRSAGDCLLDSIFQATWGIFDRDNILRNALYVSLSEGAARFFPRWKEWEEMQATTMQFSLDEDQWEQDWASVLSLASQPGTSLEQTHVFALAHIVRRPIIIYGVKYVRSFRGETLGLARFQGVYLPLLWEKSFCWKSPIVLGYTRGHFSALVTMETELHGAVGAGAHIDNSDESHVSYLPLVDNECKLLPVHFLNGAEIGSEEQLLRDWLDCHITNTGILVAEQRATPRPALANQLIHEWLDRYRKMNKEMTTDGK